MIALPSQNQTKGSGRPRPNILASPKPVKTTARSHSGAPGVRVTTAVSANCELPARLIQTPCTADRHTRSRRTQPTLFPSTPA